MEQKQWNEICRSVTDEMAKYVSKVVTPISLSDDLVRGQALATGNYMKFRGVPYLLTNEHVVDQAAGQHLAHLPGPTDDYILCNNPIQTIDWPADIALLRLVVEPNGYTPEVVPASRLDTRFSPADSELLFWLGFPGSTAARHEPITELKIRRTWFGSLAGC